LYAVAVFAAPAADSTRNVQLNQVPPEARKAIETQLAGAKITDIERDDDDGSFTVSYKSKTGKERDFTVGEDGTLMSVEVTLDEAPIPVQRTIKAQVGAGTIENVEKSFEDDEITYDVDMKSKDGVERSFSVALDGQLQAMQMLLEETPAAVRKTIESSLGTAKLEDIFHIFEGSETSYYIEVRRDGKLRDFSVTENGKLQSVQVFLSETPAEVQSAIKEKVGGGKVLRVDKSFEARRGVLPYEIEARKDGKAFNFSVGPRGRFLGMDE
jgi:uncharacterized membrane protein YkoI